MTSKPRFVIAGEGSPTDLEYVMTNELRDFLAVRVERRAWFHGNELSDGGRRRWLEAWEDKGEVPSGLIGTLPPARQPRRPDARVELTSTSWQRPAGQPASNYRMREDLRAFLGGEHRKRYPNAY